ncbi:MAG: relaxase domain-containing protein, partial [Actinomycetota bacterium]|nr:relaxase domain-containing protein [Actinomycetota bacterium]
LRAVLAGEDPRDGTALPIRRPAHRRAGWDLTFAAPKSLSLLAALAPPGLRQEVVASHDRAVADAIGYLERRACWAARGGHLVAVEGVVAASFAHLFSAAGDPHVHTHVVMANVVQAHDGRWSALARDPLWLTQRAVDGLYLLGLRHQLAAQGFAVDWDLGPDGRADITGVPRAAIDAASSRHRQIEVALTVRPEISARARHILSRQTRTAPSPSPHEPAWASRVAATGFGPAAAEELLVTRDVPVAPGDRIDDASHHRMASWLAARQSTFSVSDALCAVAATTPGGLDTQAAEARAAAFCRQADPVSGGRWTTALARAADQALVDMATRRRAAGVAIVSPTVVTTAITDRGGDCSTVVDAARQLVSGGDGVSLVGGAAGEDRWWAQAQAVDVARTAWQMAGYRVAVLTDSAAAALRWQALTGTAAVASLRAIADEQRPPEVLVVDRADRRTTAELTEVVRWAAEHAAKTVCVLGGTQVPRREPLSRGLADLRHQLGALEIGPPGPLVMGTPPAVHRGSRSATLSGPDAARVLLDRWDQARSGGEAPWLIGAGPAEVDVLNDAARRRLVTDGTIAGPAVAAGGRTYQPGDRVLAIRQIAVPAGTVGLVRATDPDAGTLSVDWGQRQVTLDRHDARRISHGYATTPAMLHLVEGPLLVLGDPRQLGRESRRVAHAAFVIPASAAPSMEQGRLQELARQATLSADRAVEPLPIERSLVDLTAERAALFDDLNRGLPEDPRPHLRRAEDTRDWLASPWSTPGPDATAWWQRQGTTAARAVDKEEQWVTDNADALRRWDLLGRALEARRNALGQLLASEPATGREVVPSRAITAHRGPQPQHPEGPELGLGW